MGRLGPGAERWEWENRVWCEKKYGIEVGNEGGDSKNWRASERQYGSRGNILQSMREILMKAPNNVGNRPEWPFLVSKRNPSTGTRFYPIELLAEVLREISKQPRLRQLLALHKQTTRAHCWRLHLPYSLTMERSSNCLYRTSSPWFWGIWHGKVPWRLPKDKCIHRPNHINLCSTTCPAHKIC